MILCAIHSPHTVAAHTVAPPVAKSRFDLARLPLDIVVRICRHLDDDSLFTVACVSKAWKLLCEGSDFLAALYGVRLSPAQLLTDSQALRSARDSFASIRLSRGRAYAPEYIRSGERSSGGGRPDCIISFRTLKAMLSARIDTRQGVRVECLPQGENFVTRLGDCLLYENTALRYFAANFRNALTIRSQLRECPPCGIRLGIRCQPIARTPKSSGLVYLSLHCVRASAAESTRDAKLPLLAPNLKIAQVQVRAHGQSDPPYGLYIHVPKRFIPHVDGIIEFQLRYLPACTADLRIYSIEISAARNR